MAQTIRDKSLLYYGRPFHILFDSLTQPQRDKIIEQIPEESRVLDVGCGTGELGISLREKKNCQVVGVDLSLRMINYANSRNLYPEVTFLHRDAANISDFGEQHFDYGVLCQVIHELPREIQENALRELLRLARVVILLDYSVPLPRNARGFVSKTIEATIGRDHYHNFKAYLKAGGLEGILAGN